MAYPEILDIIPGTNKSLRLRASEIADPMDPEIASLVQDMLKTLRENNGVGLAAPQIGKPLRLFVIEIDYVTYIFINPVIKNSSKDKIEMEEGCLSFPGLFKPVERSKKVTVAYFNEEGKKKRLKAKGLLARAIQHEYDHLEGILFIDRCKKQQG